MTKNQKLIAVSAILLGIGVFMTSNFFKKSDKDADSDDNKNFGGDCGCNKPNDPQMMLEVNPQNFPNFSGNDEMLLAKKNYPFGENFAVRRTRSVSAKPFYSANRRGRR